MIERGKNMNQSTHNATIKDVRQRHGLTALRIAEMAGIPLRVEYLMEIGCPVSKGDAKKVLLALSSLTGDRSVLANVSIRVD
jgi:hypothetical protein